MQEFSAVGMLEYTSIASGIEAADRMVKAADVIPLFCKTICPGKFLAGVTGGVAAVEASLEAGRSERPEDVADWFMLPNIHPDVVAALGGCVPLNERGALGVLETFSVASAVSAADAAVKAADVRLLEVRTALGLGGKGYILLTGDVGAVRAAISAGTAWVEESGLLVGATVLPRPADALFDKLL